MCCIFSSLFGFVLKKQEISFWATTDDEFRQVSVSGVPLSVSNVVLFLGRYTPPSRGTKGIFISSSPDEMN